MAEKTLEIGVVIAGAGARGAYEAGLLADLLPEIAARTQAEGQVARFWFIGTSAGSLNSVLIASRAPRVVPDQEPGGGPRAVDGDDGRGRRGLGKRQRGPGHRAAAQWPAPGGADPAHAGRAAAADQPAEHRPAAPTWPRIRRSWTGSSCTATSSTGRSGRSARRRPPATAARWCSCTGTTTARPIPATRSATSTTWTARAGSRPSTCWRPRRSRWRSRRSGSPQPPEWEGWYYDGGVRLNTPLKPAIELGLRHLVIVGTHPDRYDRDELPDPALPCPEVDEAAVPVANQIMADQLIQDLQTLRSRNRVQPRRRRSTCSPAPRPSTRWPTWPGTRPTHWTFARQLRQLLSAEARDELSSYLLFDPGYLSASVEAGRIRAQEAGVLDPDTRSWTGCGEGSVRDRAVVGVVDLGQRGLHLRWGSAPASGVCTCVGRCRRPFAARCAPGIGVRTRS